MKNLKLTDAEELIKLKVEKLAKEKFQEYNLEDWKFVWGTALSQFGVCDRQKKTIRMSLILSVSSGTDPIDTFLHELAHALTPNEIGHGAEWKAMCAKVGALPERVGSTKVVPRAGLLPANGEPKERKSTSYRLTCPCCTFYTTTSRKSSRSSSCPKCSSKYDERFKLIWSEPIISIYFK